MTPPHDGSILGDDTVGAPPDVSGRSVSPAGHAIPAYLRSVYTWAYINPTNARLLDRNVVASAILFGNYARLRRACLREIEPGQHVLQAAHVYGGFVRELAERVGPDGRLDVVDVVPLQAELCRRKLQGFRNARVRVADAADPGPESYDVVSAFFLLHEIPDEQKRAVVDALLARLKPDGKAVFIDYHAPAVWHPLRLPLRRVFGRLEPFAESLWHHDIESFASEPAPYQWHKTTLFGGVYQKTVAQR